MFKSSIAATSIRFYQQATDHLNLLANSIPPLLLRVILAVEFGTAGLEKLHGTNWFTDLTFPFPFNLLPADISWNMAMSFEIGGAIALILGIATRFFSVSLVILTIVAIAAVHWPSQWMNFSDLITGYRIIDEEGDGLGNYKLPLIYIIMFLPLLFGGAGKLSIDYWLKSRSAQFLIPVKM